ncbi:MAG: hypothetical protein QM619_06940 [Micropruina sp.]|uniref:hypothetical protein n=1 Tax=Micropruina sp. TaxID=2737536 RepID=UPI0039E27CB1
MRYPDEPLRLLDGLIAGLRFAPAEAGDAPTIVYLHGGESQASDAVVQLGAAAYNGYPGISLNRPDYLDSASLGMPYDQDEGFYLASAKRLDDAIALRGRRRHGGRLARHSRRSAGPRLSVLCARLRRAVPHRTVSITSQTVESRTRH